MKNNLRIAIKEAISFVGVPEYVCVGIVDMVNSTNITAKLSHKEVGTYYGIFLNTMSTIAKGFGAVVVKNIGDGLLFYFPESSPSYDTSSYDEVLNCGMAMIEAHPLINELMEESKLAPLYYRISADYGSVMLADSVMSFNKDIFGSTVNACSRMNSRAAANTMVIGGDLYEHVKNNEDYWFREIEPISIGQKQQYAIYHVKLKTSKTFFGLKALSNRKPQVSTSVGTT